MDFTHLPCENHANVSPISFMIISELVLRELLIVVPLMVLVWIFSRFGWGFKRIEIDYAEYRKKYSALEIGETRLRTINLEVNLLAILGLYLIIRFSDVIQEMYPRRNLLVLDLGAILHIVLLVLFLSITQYGLELYKVYRFRGANKSAQNRCP